MEYTFEITELNYSFMANLMKLLGFSAVGLICKVFDVCINFLPRSTNGVQ